MGEVDAHRNIARRAFAAQIERLAPYAGVAVGLAYFAAMAAFYPFRERFEFNQDEGFEAIKALLVHRGHTLYAEIWDDQPPLFTYLLLWSFQVLGWDINSARLSVLLFASLLVFAVYDSLRVTWSHRAALAAAALLPCTTYFMELSVSAMAGLPSIALAMLCLWALLRWNKSGRWRWLVTGGLAMGLSLSTKLFTAFLLPVFGVWILLLSARTQSWRLRQTLTPAAVWSLSVVISAVAILLIWVPIDFDQVVRSHALHRQVELAQEGRAAQTLVGLVLGDREVALLAGLGSLLLVLDRRWSLLIVPAWCLVAFFAQLLHAPIFYHYHLLLSVPACVVGGIALAELTTGRWRRLSPTHVLTRAATGVVVALLLASFLRPENRERTYVLDWGERDRFVVEVMQRLGPTRLVVTDRLMYAFRSGYPVPPNLAVISRKRMESDNLRVEEIVETIDRERPEQVVVSWNLGEARAHQIADALRGRYQLGYFDIEDMRLRLYVRNDLSDQTMPALLAAARELPRVAQAHDWIGILWAREGEIQNALASFQRAHEIDPTDARTAAHLAESYMAAGDYQNGFGVLRAAMQTSDREEYREVARRYAWRRATCPDPAHRDGAEAREVAEKIVQQLKKTAPSDLETMAAGFAAEGKFALAAEMAESAIALARKGGIEEAAARIQPQLEAYRRQQAWIVPVGLPQF
jgi:4-amino-4-deoxy-L-arabinose transferase-like glycosyltransferase